MFKRAKGFDSIIGPGVHLTGILALQPQTTTVLECSGNIAAITRRDNFDGTVAVEIRTDLHVVDIDVGSLMVSGTLRVKDLVCDKLIVTRTGKVIAETITVDNMEIQSGGVIFGNIKQGVADGTVSD